MGALLGLVLIGIVLWALLGSDDDGEVDAGDAATETTLPVEERIEDPAGQAPDDALAGAGVEVLEVVATPIQKPSADSADVHDLPEDQGAEQHRLQGHHIEMRSITPVG